MLSIGFIGLGHMGNPMVQNLLKAGHEVYVHDLSKEAVAALVKVGAHPVADLKELAAERDVVFTMLQTGDQVREICLSATGLFQFLDPACLYIDSSSIDVATTREISRAAHDRNLKMLDAPVSGGVAGAKAAALTIMVGGEEADFQQAMPILSLLGKKVIYAGPAGNGQVAKICNNMILGVSMIAVSEGFVLAKKLGLEPQKFFEIASNASAQCWSLSQYCPMPDVLKSVPSSHDFVPGFAAGMMLKDLKLSQAAAVQADVATPLGAEATALYALFVHDGNFNVDFSGIIKMIAGEGEI